MCEGLLDTYFNVLDRVSKRENSGKTMNAY